MRALLEAFSCELEVIYGHLQLIYNNAFLETRSSGRRSPGILTIVELGEVTKARAQPDVAVEDSTVASASDRISLDSALAGTRCQDSRDRGARHA